MGTLTGILGTVISIAALMCMLAYVGYAWKRRGENPRGFFQCMDFGARVVAGLSFFLILMTSLLVSLFSLYVKFLATFY